MCAKLHANLRRATFGPPHGFLRDGQLNLILHKPQCILADGSQGIEPMTHQLAAQCTTVLASLSTEQNKQAYLYKLITIDWWTKLSVAVN